MTAPIIMAATKWKTNGHLVAALARLGYVHQDRRTLDLTWGLGVWWNQWRPDELVRNGYAPEADTRYDFRQTGFEDREFRQIAFDPPYVCVGGRDTSTIPDFLERYGLTDAPRTPAEVQANVNAGLDETWRILEPRGVALVKVQAYVVSGNVFWGTDDTNAFAKARGFKKLDEAVFLNNGSPQDKNRTKKCPVCKDVEPEGCEGPCDGTGRAPVEQVHLRRNYSIMLVLQKPR